MSTPLEKNFYSEHDWDETAWIEAISVEYQELVEAYPFDSVLRPPADGKETRLLDVGCGTAIFPRFLDPSLSPEIHLACDLLDVSDRSLLAARQVLTELRHFSPETSTRSLIEAIPNTLSSSPKYDVIWSIHSFTTVDVSRMPSVYRHLIEKLNPGGHFLIYQLTRESTYQTLRRRYIERFPDGAAPFMEFEDSQRILASLGQHYDVLELNFDHEIPTDQPDLLDQYLRKCILDDSADVRQLFSDLLPSFHKDHVYRFPQSVNFITVRRDGS